MDNKLKFTFSSSVIGTVTMNHLMNRITNKKISMTNAVDKALYKQFRKIDIETSLGKTSRILEKEPFVVITKKTNSMFQNVLSWLCYA